MRALVVTNMYPTADDPARGSFVRDQVTALRAIDGVELELFAFKSAGTASYVRAARDVRRRFKGRRFDVVHAHFGLTAWPALAVRPAPHVVTLHGTDLVHPRSRAITLAALPFVDLIAPVSEALAQKLPARAARRNVAILPCGVDMQRFRARPRAEARRALGLDESSRYLLFPSSPQRPEKRYDRATAVAGEVRLLTLGRIPPDEVPLWVNASDAVVVTSERESFGLSVLEALACDVPVLATPVGIAPDLLDGVEGTLCAPFDVPSWRKALDAVLAQPDPRVEGRARAEAYSAERMARRVLAAWQRLV